MFILRDFLVSVAFQILYIFENIWLENQFNYVGLVLPKFMKMNQYRNKEGCLATFKLKRTQSKVGWNNMLYNLNLFFWLLFVRKDK